MNKEHRFSVIISWLTLVYFVVLFAERALSIVRIITGEVVGFFETPFDTFANITVCVSLAASAVMLVGFNGKFWRSLTDPETVPDHTLLSVTAGVMLVSGMIHTEFTIAPIQFASYGALIAAMALRTAETAPAAASRFRLWYSLIYLTMFSMAIPVMYHSYIEHYALFHIISAFTAVALVCCFTYMMRLVFVGKAENLLFIVPAALMAVLDTVLIIMRWSEEINTFVLIFAIISVVMFIAGRIIFAATGKKNDN